MANTKIVLYVEDEESDIFFMRLAFAKAGLESSLQTAGNGKTAMDYILGVGIYAERSRYPKPGLVLLDLNLPAISGFELLAWIKSEPEFQNLPVVIFSSSSRPEDKLKAKELGAEDYWEKPNSALLFRNVVSDVRQKWL